MQPVSADGPGIARYSKPAETSSLLSGRRSNGVSMYMRRRGLVRPSTASLPVQLTNDELIAEQTARIQAVSISSLVRFPPLASPS
jgi:hypothetical protein